MAVRYSFEPGREQALQAWHYFSLLGSDLVDGCASGSEPREFLFAQVGFEAQHVRVWCAEDVGAERLFRSLPWMRSVMGAMRTVSAASSDDVVVEHMLSWMDTHHGEETLFIELPRPGLASTSRRSLALTIGIVGGETVMLSAPNVMFMKLQHDLFGLSIASTGSYLVERLHGSVGVAADVRRFS